MVTKRKRSFMKVNDLSKLKTRELMVLYSEVIEDITN